MRRRQLLVIAGMALGMNAQVYAADQTAHWQMLARGARLPASFTQVKEFPLYTVGPDPILEKAPDQRLKAVRHFFFERTPHSLTLGARVAW